MYKLEKLDLSSMLKIINMDPEVKVELKKLSSAQLCSSALGQVCMDAVVNPPKPGEPSHDLFIKVIYRFLCVNIFKFNIF